MESDLSIGSLILGASFLVKLVMVLLFAASIISWGVIFSKRSYLKKVREQIAVFENEFWSCKDLTVLYERVTANDLPKTAGLSSIFEAGFGEFVRLRKQGGIEAVEILDGCERSMKISLSKELETLESDLPTLATIGSVSPYVGLLGTVWGIMNSFQALGNVHQATLAMVAPGISEALVATAMGLFAAIPAVVAFNRYSTAIDQIYGRSELFIEEFLAIVRRQAKE